MTLREANKTLRRLDRSLLMVEYGTGKYSVSAIGQQWQWEGDREEILEPFSCADEVETMLTCAVMSYAGHMADKAHRATFDRIMAKAKV